MIDCHVSRWRYIDCIDRVRQRLGHYSFVITDNENLSFASPA